MRIPMKATAVMGVLLMVGATAYADSYYNDRTPQISLGDNGGPGAGEISLQEVFDSIYRSGPGINAATQQTPFALFTNSASGGSVATMVIELAGYAPNSRFGIYDANNSNTKLEVFRGAASQGYQATIKFFDTGIVKATVTDQNGDFVYQDSAAGFSRDFGFFLDPNGAGGYFYSQDSLNNGVAQALVYRGDGETTLQIPSYNPGIFGRDEYIVAFEDVSRAPGGGSDSDFQDMVVMVESITPVPVPGAALLGLLGFSLIGWIKRRFA